MMRSTIVLACLLPVLVYLRLDADEPIVRPDVETGLPDGPPGGPRAGTPNVPDVQLFEWERGVGVRSLTREDMAVYLWFYEWHLFGAIDAGQHTRGTYRLKRNVSTDGTTARITSPELDLEVKAVSEGAELRLTVKNTTERDWPEIAAIIPCFNPGPKERRNALLANTSTYFLSSGGLKKLEQREIHFNDSYRERIEREASDGKFVFSFKWPTADVNATGGLLLRESTDREWVAGIAWEDFLSAQGHNPWECMHLSIRVGPLAPGESKTVKGRIYLFKGGREEGLERFRRDFGPESRPFYLSFTQGLPPQTEQVFRIAAEHADMMALHFDSGVPWSEALDEKPYPKEVEDLIASLRDRLGEDRKVYLALTPIAFTRNQKAAYWGANESSAAARSWKEKPLDAPEVIAAYTRHCRRMIRELEPSWMAYGIEVNMLASSNPAAFGEYLVLARKVYETLKKENPDLPLFQTIQIDHYHENAKAQREVVRKLLPFTDYMALSCYPYMGRSPEELPGDWFASVAALAPSKPFAIAETGWPAETVVMKKTPPLVPVDLEIPMTEEDQVRYVRFILESSRRLDARFVVWFFAQDFDILYELLGEKGENQNPLWEFAKWWRDTGLVGGDGKPRKALRLWDEWLELPRR